MEIEHTRVPKRIRILCIAIFIHLSIASDVDEMPLHYATPVDTVTLETTQPSRNGSYYTIETKKEI